MTNKTLGDAQALVADALGLPADSVSSDSSIYTLDSWDSMAHLRIILEIERVTGHELDTDQILSIESVKDVSGLMNTINVGND
jgi:acyl carrier protein